MQLCPCFVHRRRPLIAPTHTPSGPAFASLSDHSNRDRDLQPSRRGPRGPCQENVRAHHNRRPLRQVWRARLQGLRRERHPLHGRDGRATLDVEDDQEVRGGGEVQRRHHAPSDRHRVGAVRSLRLVPRDAPAREAVGSDWGCHDLGTQAAVCSRPVPSHSQGNFSG